MTIRVVVSGIPRGYQFPRPDGNWLQERHRRRILETSPDIGDGVVDIFCDNLRRYVEGEPLLNVCDPERGY